ncbi:MAG: multicopper oxidase domain-containing protein [Cyanobacteria bacterium Co-bin13]|nr:multicopper oxidase domain-containing protein [Cyanobacteria bacterium Co-bin13]
MSSVFSQRPFKGWSRRQFLGWGAAGVGLVATSTAVGSRLSAQAPARIPPLPVDYRPPSQLPFDPMAVLRDFDYGTLKRENGRTVREFEVTATSTPLQLNSALSFVSWNLNGRVPGPTLRARAGEWVRVIFHNQDGHSHSLHFHGIHPAEMDGVQPVRHDQTRVYEFEASPFGVHPYHCHIAPVTRHISKGLYGLFIVDPPQPRPAADELVLVMGGYDLKGEDRNSIYAFNGIPNYYRDHPIAIYQNQRVRVYLLNMIEFDAAITFHIHANLFRLYRTGRTLTPSEESDVVTMGTAERHILEFAYPYPGQYMFHPHQDAIAENGCMGLFDVLPS